MKILENSKIMTKIQYSQKNTIVTKSCFAQKGFWQIFVVISDHHFPFGPIFYKILKILSKKKQNLKNENFDPFKALFYFQIRMIFQNQMGSNLMRLRKEI